MFGGIFAHSYLQNISSILSNALRLNTHPAPILGTQLPAQAQQHINISIATTCLTTTLHIPTPDSVDYPSDWISASQRHEQRQQMARRPRPRPFPLHRAPPSTARPPAQAPLSAQAPLFYPELRHSGISSMPSTVIPIVERSSRRGLQARQPCHNGPWEWP